MWKWNTNQSIYFIAYTTHLVVSTLIIGLNSKKASSFLEKHFLEPPKVTEVTSRDQVWDSIDYELRDKIFEEIEEQNAEDEADAEDLEEAYPKERDNFFKKISLKRKPSMFVSL